MIIKKGDVVYLYEPVVKDYSTHLTGGNRPYIVISNDFLNHFSDNCMIVPLTTKEKRELPTHTKVDGGRHTALCEEIYTISKQQIERIHHQLTIEDIGKLNQCLRAVMGIE